MWGTYSSLIWSAGREHALILHQDNVLKLSPAAASAWGQQLSKLQELTSENILSIGPTPADIPSNIERILSNEPSCDPLEGLLAALKSTTSEYLLVFSIDLPLVPVEFLQELLKGWGGAIPFVINRATLVGRGMESLCAVYPVQDTITEIEELMFDEEGDFEPGGFRYNDRYELLGCLSQILTEGTLTRLIFVEEAERIAWFNIE